MGVRIESAEKLDLFLQEKRDKSEDFKALVLKLSDRLGVEEASKLSGVPKPTIYKWIREWNQKGEESLQNRRGKGGGRKSKLSDAQKEELLKLLKEEEFWTTQQVKRLIFERFGIEYSDVQISRILRGFGMRMQKPYVLDHRKPKKAEEILRRELENCFAKLKEEGIKPEDLVIGFLDESSPQTVANTVRIWIWGEGRFKKNTQKIKSNTIAFYALKGEDVIGFLEDSSADSIIEFLSQIKDMNREAKRIVIILDNFPSHRSRALRQKAKELGIELLYLPPYSPDLNPIEFIWKSIKRVISITFIRSAEHMRELIERCYKRLCKKLSFARWWISKFFNPVWNAFSQNYTRL